MDTFVGTSRVRGYALVGVAWKVFSGLRVLHRNGNSDGRKVLLSIISERKGNNWPLIKIKWRVCRMLPGDEFVIVL
jgi:hypothetical protein